MARPTQITRNTLAPLLMARGPVSAAELAAALRVNRTTVVRALADFGSDLITLGATRSTRYLLRRTIPPAGNSWPVYRIDEAGQASHWATLDALYAGRRESWRILWTGTPPVWADRFADATGLWQGFPFFLAEVQPQGFLGRALARQASRFLPVPDDPRRWSDDHTLICLQAMGEDLPGSLVVGDACLRRALTQAAHPEIQDTTAAAERDTRYPVLAELASTSLPGSSAGGEQPKFLTTLRHGASPPQPVLVKFSPPLDQPAGRRWGDLLLCECHALTLLSEHGMALPGATILDAGGRRFLQVPRFDRVSTSGRRGVVSLGALHPAALGFAAGNAWPAAAHELQSDGLISSATATAIRKLHAFGELIGNTDMHAGNLAFWLEETLPFRLTPAYDMLPMLWAPGAQGEIAERTFAPAPPLPAARAEWLEAAGWAVEFWSRLADEPRLSDAFRDIARTSSAVLHRLAAAQRE